MLNRAERTKKYLIGQLQLFERYAGWRDSNEAFFPAIATFRNSTVSCLRSTKLIRQVDIDEFDRILANIDSMKSKGYDSKVYWSRVGPEYDKAKSMLNEFILLMDETTVPFRLRFKDFMKDIFTEKSAGIIILGIVTVIVAGSLTGVLDLLINWLLSLFK
ncbi:hypothetical protein AMJ44_15885 [candidate division WOR-1 bacterium DG_54_3]|uniref:Uncharacterized protein n=1 Tax=candidate division WOR-1 bacterium DG_54_3 TaxID=1703775 RepID=A0A0S7XJ52_UNCSA|nr:MAG: hypothetical protein AMJ44_15885 [candidate division WOR-1 bacterium DG_54_3]